MRVIVKKVIKSVENEWIRNKGKHIVFAVWHTCVFLIKCKLVFASMIACLSHPDLKIHSVCTKWECFQTKPSFIAPLIPCRNLEKLLQQIFWAMQISCLISKLGSKLAIYALWDYFWKITQINSKTVS